MAAPDPPSAAVEQVVDEIAALFDRGELDTALARADDALARRRDDVPLLHWRAAILAELGRLDDARAAYEDALRRAGDDLDLLVDTADFYVSRAQDADRDREWLERGLEVARTGQRLATRRRDGEAAGELAFIEGVALSELGRPDEALSRLDAAARARPDDPAVLMERGFTLYELSRLDEARKQLLDVVRRVPEEAWAHHTLGLIAERAGDAHEARRRFETAHEIAPEDFPQPVELSSEEFDAAVEDALRSLPEQVRSYLANVAITVEDLPSADDLLASSPPLSPSILGIFRGAPLGDKASMDPWSHFPSTIVLYQKNLERFARDREELIEQIGVTLVHEVGHFLGLDEDDLWERGLD